MLKLRYFGDPILTQSTDVVSVAELKSKKLQSFIEEMKKVVNTTTDAIALAAPQVGESKKIFVVSGKIFHPDFSEEIDSETLANIPNTIPDLVFINPTITKTSKQTQILEEGCLSIPHVYGKVKRAHKITIRATNEHGQIFERGCSGLLAQIVQHELDHINGVLFTDKATDMVWINKEMSIPINADQIAGLMAQKHGK